MTSIALNLDPLLYGGLIALAVALLGTPALWRAGHGAPPHARAIGTCLGCVGLAGLAYLPFALSAPRMEETSLSAVLAAAVLQGLALPVLLLLSRKS